MRLWEDRVRPTRLADVAGHVAAKAALTAWITSTARPRRPVLLAGPSGCGKTTLARALFADHGYRVWDESQLEGEDSAADALRCLLARPPLVGTQPRAILVECAEGIIGEERAALTRVLKSLPATSSTPILVTCDDPHDQGLRGLKDACVLVPLKALAQSEARAVLRGAAAGLDKTLSVASADMLLESAHGNVRHALNEMQFLVSTKAAHRRTTVSGATSSSGGPPDALSECDKPWDLFADCAQVCSGVFTPHSEEIASSDADIALLMLQHNGVSGVRDIHGAAAQLAALSFADTMSARYETPLAIAVAVRATAAACSGGSRCPRMQFPLYYGKMSSRGARETRLRIAGAGPLPVVGPTLEAGSVGVARAESSGSGSAAKRPRHASEHLEGAARVTPLAHGTMLAHVRPSAFEAHDRLAALSARVRVIEDAAGRGKRGAGARALQAAGLWLASHAEANDLLRAGVQWGTT